MTGRIERLQKVFHVHVRWRAFPLHPETPEEGQTLEALFAGQPVDIPAMLSRLRQVAAELGLPFGDRKMTFNSRLAQELGKWAEDRGCGDTFHQAAFRAYFRDGANLAQHGVLLKICTGIGLDPAVAQTVLDRRSYRQAVDRDWQRSRRMGISAVPTFVLGDRRLIGAQSYAALEDMLVAAGVRRRAPMGG